MLGVFTFLGDGSKRDLVLGFSNITESELRARVASALPVWTNRYVEHFQAVLESRQITEQDAAATYIQLEQVNVRGLVSPLQVEKMRTALARIVPPAAKAAAPASSHVSPFANDRVANLKILADLRASGALTQAEFEAEKARVLSAG